MKKVSQIIEEFDISKSRFVELANKISGKNYSNRVTVTSQEVYDDIRKYFEHHSHKTITKKNVDSGEDDFLSGMGFASSKKETKEEKPEEDLHEYIQELAKKKSEKKKKASKKKVKSKSKKVENAKVIKPKSKKPKVKVKTKKKSSKSTSKPTNNIKVVLKKDQKPKRKKRRKIRSNKAIKSASNKQARKPRKKKKAKASDTLVKKKKIELGETISVKELAEKMGIDLTEVMKKLLENQIMVAAHANIDFDTASLIGEEFGVQIVKEQQNLSVENMVSGNLDQILEADKKASNVEKRPPIVTIMGHVDHGKTKLLDYIRSSNIVSDEAGGITQSIGASQVQTDNGEKITFVDTPGHSLFTSMRARGAKITDIVILVVAADDGVKQQTKEAIHHAKEAGVPIIVAITKVDKKNINIEMVKSQLSEYEIIPEDWGGSNIFCEVSGITGEGVDDLLENIALQSEILDLKYDPNRDGVGVVLEAHKDKGRGVLSSIVMMTGKISVGDRIVLHGQNTKVRAMYNWLGKKIKSATGGTPIELMGLSDIPEPGRLVEVAKNKKAARKKSEGIQAEMDKKNKDVVMNDLLNKIAQGEKTIIKLIVKADSFGSLEALKYAIKEIEMPENIDIKIIHDDIGGISQTDIGLAEASDAVIVGFNTKATSSIRKKAVNKDIEIKTFDIIYEVIDFIDKLIKGEIKPEEQEVVLGHLKVLGVFFQKGKTMVIGGKVADGKILNKAKFRYPQEEKEETSDVVGEEDQETEKKLPTGRIQSLQIDQKVVDKVEKGYECGMKIKGFNDIKEGDILEFFEIQEVYK